MAKLFIWYYLINHDTAPSILISAPDKNAGMAERTVAAFLGALFGRIAFRALLTYG